MQSPLLQEQPCESEVQEYVLLLQRNLPDRLAIAIKTLLNKDSPEYPVVFEAVRIHYGMRYTNSLSLCEILKRYDRDLSLTLWGLIYCDAINNGQMAEQIMDWRRRAFSDADINFKLYTYCRSVLSSEKDGSGQIRGCVRELICELDTQLIAIYEQRIQAIKMDTKSRFFSFAKTTPGLLEALFANQALDEYNYTVAKHFASQSIDFWKDHAVGSKIPEPRRLPPRLSYGTHFSAVPQLVPLQNDKPSFLGYLLLAKILWDTRMKDNAPTEADVTDFQSYIKIAKGATNPKERSYIEAEILLCAYNTNYHPHWISNTDLNELVAGIHRLENEEQRVFLTHQHRQDFAVFLKIKHLLERALEGELFPPAVMIYSRHVVHWVRAEYPHRYGQCIEKVAGYLKEACLVHGFAPAFYQYALLGLQNPDLISVDTCVQYLELSELYVYVDQAQRRQLYQSIAEYEARMARPPQ